MKTITTSRIGIRCAWHIPDTSGSYCLICGDRLKRWNNETKTFL